MSDEKTATTPDDEPKRPPHMAFHEELGAFGKESLPAWFAGAERAADAAWDAGIDFEEPRVISTPDGRSVVTGIMRDKDDISCLSAPRQIISEGSKMRLAPLAELDGLHSFEASLDPHAGGLFQHHRADLQFREIQPGHAMLALDNAVEFEYKDGRLMMGFVGSYDEGHGREACALELDSLDNLRILVDDTTVECFVNDGEAVMSTRWFPVTRTMFLAMKLDCLSAKAFGMRDGVAETYAPLK